MLVNDNLIPDLLTISSLIKCECKIGDIEIAIGRLYLLSKYNIKADEILFNTLLDGCSKNSRQDLSKIVYDKMIEHNIVPGCVTYNSLIDGQIRSKNLKNAWEIYEEMKLKGIKCDNFT